MVDKEERFEIARELRRTSCDSLGSETLQRALARIIEAKDTSWRGIMRRLAELIDLPTCSMDKTESLKTEGGETVNVWECSNCGQECEEINGSYEFCPHCGAEVVDDDD